MADHGTIILKIPTPTEVVPGLPAGTTPPAPGPPTTGQIWPRGNP